MLRTIVICLLLTLGWSLNGIMDESRGKRVKAKGLQKRRH